ncbi:hypothetical protein LTR40_010584, partial [Exophiala xenobiotica]
MSIALAEAGADIILVQVRLPTHTSTSTLGLGGPTLGLVPKRALSFTRLRDPSNTSTKLAIESLGRKATIYTADLGNQAEVSSVAPKILADGHDVSILVTCAGIQRRHPSHEFPLRDWDEVLQVNLTSVFTLCRDFGAYMLTRPASPPGSVGGATTERATGGAGDSTSTGTSTSTADATD